MTAIAKRPPPTARRGLSVVRLMQVSMSLMALLGAWMLSMGQERPELGIFSAVVVAAAFFLVDLRGYFVLSTTWANVLGLLAMTYAMWTAYASEPESRLLSLANLLVYLQWILLFRRKEPRVCWMIALLSLLQLTVGSVLSLSALFAVWMALYLAVSLTALASFTVVREAAMPRQRERRSPDAAIDIFSTPIWELPRWFFRKWSAARPVAPRWPPGNDEAQFQQRFGAARPIPGRLDWLDVPARGIFRTVLCVATSALILAPPLFLLTPRTDRGYGWHPGGTPVGQSMVGFSGSVRLGDLGEVVESPHEVMRVRLTDYDDPSRVVRAAGPLLLRGAALADYKDGQWSRRGAVVGMGNPWRPERPPQETKDLVRMEFAVEPMSNTEALFWLPPSFPIQENKGLLYDRQWESLSRERLLEHGYSYRIVYHLVTAGLREGRQLPFRPGRPEAPPDEPPRRPSDRRPHRHRSGLYALDYQALLQPFTADFVPAAEIISPPEDVADRRNKLAALKQVADAVVAGLPTGDKYARCQALLAFLNDPARFRYSLQPMKRDPDVDPIVDFLTRRREGHCEYFASALALMLRSQGIPARLVVGFKASEFNELGGFYQVRQMHAHTWTEAYFTSAELAALPGEEFHPHYRRQPRSGWLTLDPTPASPTPQVSVWDYITATRDYLQYIWGRYVLALNARQQTEDVYRPLQETLQSAVDVDGWKQWFRDVAGSLAAFRPGAVLHWRLLPLLAALLLAYAVFRLLRRLRRKRGGSRAAPAALQREAAVEFYRRLEALLAKRQLVRPPAQTQREFALAVGGGLADTPALQAVASVPRRLAELFYRVRFGGRPLDNQELRSVEQALDELEAALAGADRPRERSPR